MTSPRASRWGSEKNTYRRGGLLALPPLALLRPRKGVAKAFGLRGRLNAHATDFGGALLSHLSPRKDRKEVASTQTPSAPTRSEEGHQVEVSRRAILSLDGRTLTRRLPSRRVMRDCGALFRKRPRRPGLAQAVADRVNYPMGLLQECPSLTAINGLIQCTPDRPIDCLAIRAGG